MPAYFVKLLNYYLTLAMYVQVLCIPPDEDMGFLINLPAPCNLLFQPNPTEAEGGVLFLRFTM